MAKAATPGTQVDALADELLAHMHETSAYARLQSGLPVTTLDDLTPEQARHEGEFCRAKLAQLDRVALDGLPHEQWLLARMLRHTFASGVHAQEDYWLKFAVTPYAGGAYLSALQGILAAQPVTNPARRDNYRRLLDEYARVLDQVAVKTRAQAGRGIRVSQPAIDGVRATFVSMKTAAPQAFAVAPQRLAEATEEERAAFHAAVAKQIAERIVPAYERILAIFDASYASKAPAEVGLGQYPGGKENYLRRIADGTGSTLTPQQIHERGVAAVADLEAQMQAIRDQLGFKGDRAAFHAMLRRDPRFFVKTPEELEQRYRAILARVEPLLPKYFSRLPQAPYRVKRASPAAEAGMSYGFYQEPTPADPVGSYNYNGSNLDKRSLVTAAHLIYRELVPGAHLLLALQTENHGVHPVRNLLYYGAFAQGWAEYGANLAVEMGAFADPYDRYGHLLSQAFLATRLVVDTGMNALGWPLERGRQYMRDHTFEADAQIATETLRYSTDIFAQALDYRLGYAQFLDARQRAQAALGDRFDLRKLDTALISSGPMPLDVLREHIDWFIAQQLAQD